jgi:hypothetical protein
VLSTVVPQSDGIAWVGSNQGLFKIDVNTDTYQFFYPGNSEIPGENITPLAHTPDGRLWFTNFGSLNASEIGLGWFDGTEFGIFPVEDSTLPHAQIADMEIKELDNGYELWISCLSRGIAVLTVITDPVGIVSNENPEPAIFLQNYPNPFKNYTTISFSLPDDGNVNMTICDINGRVVYTMADTFYTAGTSSVTWNGGDNLDRPVSPGIYICRLTTGDISKSIRMVVQ